MASTPTRYGVLRTQDAEGVPYTYVGPVRIDLVPDWAGAVGTPGPCPHHTYGAHAGRKFCHSCGADRGPADGTELSEVVYLGPGL